MIRLIVPASFVAAIASSAFFARRSTHPAGEMASIDTIASPASAGSTEPNLAVGPKGNVYMTWLEPTASGHALRIASLTGTQWSRSTTITTRKDFFLNWADIPSVAVVGDRHLAVHWLQRTGTSAYAYGVRVVQSLDDGQTWSAPVTPHRDTVRMEHGFAAMWADGPGPSIAWLDGRNTQDSSATGGSHHAGEMALMATSIGSRGKLGLEVRLDDRTCDCCQNSVALTRNGPIIAYRNRTTSEVRDIYVTRRVNGQWIAGRPVANDNWKINACPVNGPAIAASGDRVAVSWFTGAGDTLRVNAAFSSDGGATWGKPVRVDDGNPGGRVGTVLLDDGSALVSWIERTRGDLAEVRVRRVTADGATGKAITVTQNSAARASGVPKMVRAGDDVVFAWTVPGRPSRIRLAKAAASSLR